MMNLPKAVKRSTPAFVCDAWLFMKDTIVGLMWRRLSGGVLLWLLLGTAAQAQIVPDNTLGGERSTIVPRAAGGDSITGGAIRGSNLFQSFSAFNIGTGQQVYFANPTGIQNILTRITGGSASNIDGTLGVDGSANLFLLNPNGILFGQNAKLDVRGSFLATTANAIGFETQGEFSATNPSGVPLLTVQPSALLYTQLNSGRISVQSIANAGETVLGNPSTGLRVPDGQNLLLVGGDISIDGGNNYGGVKAFGGHIELGGLAGTGAIRIDPQFRLTYPSGVAKSDVTLTNTGRANVTGDAGSITVNANTLTLTDAGQLAAGIYTTGKAGDITINADTIQLSGSRADGTASGIVNLDNANAVGNTGNISVNTHTLNLLSGAQIVTDISGQGNAGDVVINARDINLQGYVVQEDGTSILGSAIFTRLEPGAVGKAGDIRINTQMLNLSDATSIASSTGGQGNAGNISIDASKGVSLRGNPNDRTFFANGTVPLINASVQTGGIGNGGNIQIRTNVLSLVNPSVIDSSTDGQGNAGNITINASDRIFVDGGFITSNVFASDGNPANQRQGGNIQVTTGSMQLTGGGGLSAASNGRGNSGNIFVDARGEISLSNKSEITTVIQALNGSTAIGNAGNIQINAGLLNLSSGGAIFSFSTQRGNAGAISINTSEDISIDNSSIASFLLSFQGSTAIGNAGNVNINARSLFLRNGSGINSVINGQGDGGNITIHATDQVVLDGGSHSLSTPISTQVGSSGIGNGGNIQINSRSLLLNNGGQLLALSSGQGDAGNISIQTGAITLRSIIPPTVNDVYTTGIFTNVSKGGSGRGGNVTVRADSLLLDRSAISSESAISNGGNLDFSISKAIVLRHRSAISSSAGTTESGGNGGNININAGTIVSVSRENTKIIANAYSGNGGNVNITTNGIFGIQAGIQPNNQSRITASSQLGVQGNITIAQPETQPIQGAIELPTTVLDASNQLTQICPRDPQLAKAGSFIVSGRGSLPLNPMTPLTGTIVTSPLAMLDTLPTNHADAASPKALPSSIVEAQGWIKKRDGTIELVAQTPETTPPIVAACPTVTP